MYIDKLNNVVRLTRDETRQWGNMNLEQHGDRIREIVYEVRGRMGREAEVYDQEIELRSCGEVLLGNIMV
jgi:hypothetical protein